MHASLLCLYHTLHQTISIHEQCKSHLLAVISVSKVLIPSEFFPAGINKLKPNASKYSLKPTDALKC